MGVAVGIDLGTTYSAVAYIGRTGRPEVLENAEGELTTPSVVLFNSPDDVVVGKIAKELAVVEAGRVVAMAKRHMGDPDYRFLIDGRDYSPEYVSACILRKLVKDASDRLGEPVEQAVITVPAYFGNNERRATADAGKRAGLEVLAIVDEPTAAALSFGVDKGAREETLLVYDLGGGTFDVTVMRLSAGKLEVLATDGHRFLGGEDFDRAVMQFVTDGVLKEHGIDLQADLASTQDLRLKTEERKKLLAQKDSVEFSFRLDGKSIRVPLTLATFNDLISERLTLTEPLLQSVLSTAGLTWGQIDRVLLVGGSTRLRAVPELIKRVSGRDPSREVHPDQAVALGAAVRAASFVMSKTQREEFGLPAPEDIVERVAHPLGIAVLNAQHELFVDHILPAQSKKGESVARGPYTTVSDNQPQVELRIYEGASTDPEASTLLGSAVLDTRPLRPRGGPQINVMFQYNQNGVIEVEARDTGTGQEARVEIRPTVGADEAEIARDRDRLLAATIV